MRLPSAATPSPVSATFFAPPLSTHSEQSPAFFTPPPPFICAHRPSLSLSVQLYQELATTNEVDKMTVDVKTEDDWEDLDLDEMGVDVASKR